MPLHIPILVLVRKGEIYVMGKGEKGGEKREEGRGEEGGERGRGEKGERKRGRRGRGGICFSYISVMMSCRVTLVT